MPNKKIFNSVAIFGGELSHLHPTYLMMRSQADIVIGNVDQGFSMEDLDILDKRIDSTTKIFIFSHGADGGGWCDLILHNGCASDIFIRLKQLSQGNALNIFIHSCDAGNIDKLSLNTLPENSSVIALSGPGHAIYTWSTYRIIDHQTEMINPIIHDYFMDILSNNTHSLAQIFANHWYIFGYHGGCVFAGKFNGTVHRFEAAPSLVNLIQDPIKIMNDIQKNFLDLAMDLGFNMKDYGIFDQQVVDNFLVEYFHTKLINKSPEITEALDIIRNQKHQTINTSMNSFYSMMKYIKNTCIFFMIEGLGYNRVTLISDREKIMLMSLLLMEPASEMLFTSRVEISLLPFTGNRFFPSLSEENRKTLWDYTIRKVFFGYIEKEVSYIKNVIDNTMYYIEETGNYLIDWLNNSFDNTQDI